MQCKNRTGADLITITEAEILDAFTQGRMERAGHEMKWTQEMSRHVPFLFPHCPYVLNPPSMKKKTNTH